jgi:Flp pilus assembly protein TadG
MIFKMIRGNRLTNALRPGEEGSALVELAFSMPMLTIMLLGSAEFARLAYASIEVANGAHAAAIYASYSQAASSDTTGIGNAANSDAANLVGGDAISVTSVTSACSCADTSFTPASCSDNSTCISNNTSMVTTVTVQTQAEYSPVIRIPGTATSYTIHASSTQVVSNE